MKMDQIFILDVQTLDSLCYKGSAILNYDSGVVL